MSTGKTGMNGRKNIDSRAGEAVQAKARWTFCSPQPHSRDSLHLHYHWRYLAIYSLLPALPLLLLLHSSHLLSALRPLVSPRDPSVHQEPSRISTFQPACASRFEPRGSPRTVAQDQSEDPGRTGPRLAFLRVALERSRSLDSGWRRAD